MKVLIAYDGSASADTAIEGLQRAGLPSKDVEALVVSVAEVWLPPPSQNEVLDDTFPLQIPPGLKLARERAASMMADAEEVAQRGRKHVEQNLPEWSVTQEVKNGSPAFEILNRAEQFQPQLIVVGSHGRTALGRFVLGSVSQKILTEALCSVRIGRPSPGSVGSAQRIVLGVDGSRGSTASVVEVGSRNWTPGSEVRVVVAQDLMKTFPASLLIPPVKEFVEETNKEEHTAAEAIIADAIKLLRASLADHVSVSTAIDSGDPKAVLVKLAEEFGADCIFTGATGFSNRLERFILGSVSAAVAARAHCSVEVIRELNALN